MLEFEQRGIAIDTPAQETVDIDRVETRRRLDFVTAKLGSSAMQDVTLGEGFDELAQSDLDLAA
ncbi:hypothetical protein GII36_05270 [Candidatus Mycosynbacter amalyticus]|uniref:Uncharacterized protein n=1 Tax=Candidatus Mycosynbacter amalyticus TaxID=2665156 RepID=A0A857MPQ5_9BACT|nr:hypothetical protein [Candidatus Mycosynbacter amalyticus]QHN43229.1 hypothetical protein GII36_05270 [Candidatus Mycosynbacter amalyticus]